MKEMTEKQKAVLDFVINSMSERGVPPTLGEIGKRFDISVGTVYQYLEALQKKGQIDYINGETRGIRLKNYRVKLEAVNG